MEENELITTITNAIGNVNDTCLDALAKAEAAQQKCEDLALQLDRGLTELKDLIKQLQPAPTAAAASAAPSTSNLDPVAAWTIYDIDRQAWFDNRTKEIKTWAITNRSNYPSEFFAKLTPQQISTLSREQYEWLHYFMVGKNFPAPPEPVEPPFPRPMTLFTAAVPPVQPVLAPAAVPAPLPVAQIQPRGDAPVSAVATPSFATNNAPGPNALVTSTSSAQAVTSTTASGLLAALQQRLNPKKPRNDGVANGSMGGGGAAGPSATQMDLLKQAAQKLNLGNINQGTNFSADKNHGLSQQQLDAVYSVMKGASRRYCWTCQKHKLLPQFHNAAACPFQQGKGKQ